MARREVIIKDTHRGLWYVDGVLTKILEAGRYVIPRYLDFPGNLQEIMNRVLAAERMSQAQLVEARTKAETQRIEAQTRAETRRLEAEAQAEAQRLEAQAEAEARRITPQADIAALSAREQTAAAYSAHPALLRLQELETLRELARTANARIYINFDKAVQPGDEKE